MMLHTAYYNLVTFVHIAFAKRRSHQVDAFGSATCEHYLVRVACADELLHLMANRFIVLGGYGGKMVCAAMYVGILLPVVVVEGVDNRGRLLRGGGIIKINQRVAVYRCRQYGKECANIVCGHLLAFCFLM